MLFRMPGYAGLYTALRRIPYDSIEIEASILPISLFLE
jgi:hypothetical protein